MNGKPDQRILAHGQNWWSDRRTLETSPRTQPQTRIHSASSPSRASWEDALPRDQNAHWNTHSSSAVRTFVLAWVYMLLALSLGRHNPVPFALYRRAPALHRLFLAAILHSERLPHAWNCLRLQLQHSLLCPINMSTNLPPADPIPKQFRVKVFHIQGTSLFNLIAITDLFLLFPNLVPCWGSHWQRLAGSCAQASILRGISHVTGSVFTKRIERLKVYPSLIYTIFLEIKRNSRLKKKA